MRTLIIGAGLGGLCLAHALRRRGLDVEVFERDGSPWDRPQGYRLHIDSDGIQALHQSLDPKLYALFDATSMRALPSTTILDTDLSMLRRAPDHPLPEVDGWPAGLPMHVNVNRATLRQVLLTGLDDVVRFGKRLSRYDADKSGVSVTFSDGTTASGDLLVGADGIRSAVRRQRAPESATQDTGVRAIYGRIPLERARQVLPAHALEDVFTVAVDERKIFLGLGPVVFPVRPEIAAARLVPSSDLRPQEDYVVCIVGGRHERFGIGDERLRTLPSEALQRLAIDLLGGWPEGTQRVAASGDPTSFFFFAVEMHTSIPFNLTAPTNVTLLGDAIHAMTPTLGRGANVAMRDAESLARELDAVAAGEAILSEALRSYEDGMTSYGFDVVRSSAAMGARLMGQEPLP